jgi:hypothetical protein
MHFPNQKAPIFAFPRHLWVATTRVGVINSLIACAWLGQIFYEARLRPPETETRK